MKILQYTILIYLFPLWLYAQDQSWTLETINEENGLSSECVTVILKDRQGFMWFGTAMGLQRYDGRQWKSFMYTVSKQNGLSDNIILDLVEAPNGNIWIATQNGLNIYDPNKDTFTHYLHDPDDTSSISSNRISTVFIDKNRTLWAGTINGLNRYNETTNTFSRFYSNDKLPIMDFNFNITSIYEDNSGALWIGTRNSGLYDMNRAQGTFQHLPIVNTDQGNLEDFITCIYEDHAGVLWIGTLNGIYQLDRYRMKYTRILYQPGNHSYPENQRFTAITEDNKGNYWIRTYDGLYQYNDSMQLLGAWKNNPYNAIPDPWKGLKYIVPDNNGIIWYNSHCDGVKKLIPRNKKFRIFSLPTEFQLRDVMSFYVENQNIIWIGTGAGLLLFDRKNNKYQLFQHDPNDEYSISNNVIPHILRDQYGTIWIATYNGLNRLIVSQDSAYRFVHYFHNPNDPGSIEYNGIHRLFNGPDGLLYIELERDLIDIFDRQKNKFLHLRFPQQGFQEIIGIMYLLESSKIWYSNGQGLLEMHLPLRECGPYCVTPDTVIQYRSVIGKPWSLSSNQVGSVFEDSKGTIWVGTGGSGLNKMILNSSSNSNTDSCSYGFKHYTKEDGLPDNDIGAILEDETGNLWIGTEMGISKFDPVQEVFTNYRVSNGLRNLHYWGYYKAPDGEMFFRSDEYLVAFYPDSIQQNPFIPPVVITDLMIFNKSIAVGDDSPLQTSISSTSEIKLLFNQNFLSFEFAALNYINPERNQYKYKMEGLDQEWIEAGTRRFARYPDLKPGTYTFRVIGSNDDNIWNMEGASLKITINPPWYASTLAYFSYGFFMIIMVLGYIRWRTWEFRRERERLEYEVKERSKELKAQKEEIEYQKELLEEQNKKILEIDELKSRFFNNISHEFRTPLTLIQGPLEDLLEHARLSKKEIHKLELISRNSKQLLNLVNQLLDIAKLESGHMKLKLVNGDILQCLRIIAGSFTSMAETRGILYNRSIPMGKYNTWFDYHMLEKIVVNLLSNAFKLTPEAGEITFRARWFHGETIESPDQLEFSVSDQGPGIPEDSLDKIFTRFYQIRGQNHLSNTGTGIGLSLVRDLVNLNHGEIRVESTEGEGSTFTIRLPLGKDHLKQDEFDLIKAFEELPNLPLKETLLKSNIHSSEPIHQIKREEKPIVLIVEDNGDMRNHICENLESDYHVVQAINGSAGLTKARQIIPDLIITDLIMPVMDGTELCSQIKSDERTSHIPVIMLTAKSSLEEKLEGLETGADDYLSKPFHMKELKTRIANLIEQRKKLRARFSKEITLKPAEISITSLDEDFLNRAIRAVEDHMSDETFDINKFQDLMHLSHSTLFRKLHALTNLSPSGFIRNIRLKRAAQLLGDHYGNVAKISYEVGFNNPAYFSKCFKSLFGVSPVDYVHKTPHNV